MNNLRKITYSTAIAAALALGASSAAFAATQNLTFNWNNGNIGSTGGFGTVFGSATISEVGSGSTESLHYSITLNDSTTTPNTWFHSPNGGTPETLGFSLDKTGATISNIAFNGGASGTSTGGGQMGWYRNLAL